MNNKFSNKIILGCLITILASINILNAQNVDSIIKRTLLLRDSLDFIDKKLSINTTSNEFSPILYKGGLMYISNQPIKAAKVAFNKIYWTENPEFKIIEDEKNQVNKGSSVTKYIKLGKGDDFTAPTSNDNNILVNYKKVKKQWNIVERNFINFSTDQAFAYNDSLHTLVYAKMSNRKINGKRHWELWQALLIDGRLKKKKRMFFDDRNANYLYPDLVNNGTTLYFASDKKGSKGGYDLYYVNLKDNKWSSSPIQLDSNINTIADEISPFVTNDSIYFSSNRVGGFGGFDIYSSLFSNTKNVSNTGYPLNSEKDEVSLKKTFNNYFLTTNRSGDFDIISMQYLPVIYPINGILTYKNDGSLVTNHIFYLKDIVSGNILDTIKTDEFAKYHFNGKPNRNYEFVTLNGDNVYEVINYATTPNQKNFEYAFSIHGLSPKQKSDSLQNLLVLAERKRLDSISASYFGNKFVVYFGFDKKDLIIKEKLVLDSLYNKLKSMPSSNIIVGAFTDCIGSYNYNYHLSVKRAKYVVEYLKYKGISKNRFVLNGYSKNYTITPCLVSKERSAQQNNRRAEIVLSEVKNTNWATLEKERGNKYYTLVSSKQNIKPLIVKTLAKVSLPAIAKEVVNKDTITKLVKVINPVIVEKKKDTIAKVAKIVKPILVEKKKDTVVKAEKVVKDFVIVATASTYKEEYSKDDIIKSLDSMATLKKELDRIVDYMTKRINKKPIEILVSSDSVSVEIYDNGIHDKDSVSIIYNNRIIVDRHELKVNKPIKFKLKVDANKRNNELVMVAENLGAEPPNTAVMFITEKSGKRQQVMLSTDMTHNEVVYFIRIGKQ